MTSRGPLVGMTVLFLRWTRIRDAIRYEIVNNMATIITAATPPPTCAKAGNSGMMTAVSG
ncbi:hypothetical protein GCM10010468_24600 [Actinocorallia longicatena]|uniref:Uncharacterized protein n=1 Tax=Actinocorallia longicatena TaxID=111803 RepID=A0ABP6Q6U1_9ACTN